MAKVNYETVIVLSTKQGEEGIKALVEKFQTLIAQNGTVDSVDEWGKRRLAYEIDHKNEGYYVLMHFKADAAFPAELHRVMGITDGILRCLVTRR